MLGSAACPSADLGQAVLSPPPGHNRPISQSGSKSIAGSLDLLYILELVFHIAAVATAAVITPGHVRRDPSTRMAEKSNLFLGQDCGILQLRFPLLPYGVMCHHPKRQQKAKVDAWICRTPRSSWPPVKTDPSPRMAAKASLVAWICCTSLSSSSTSLQSPPLHSSPPVATAPSPSTAAKANR